MLKTESKTFTWSSSVTTIVSSDRSSLHNYDTPLQIYRASFPRLPQVACETGWGPLNQDLVIKLIRYHLHPNVKHVLASQNYLGMPKLTWYANISQSEMRPFNFNPASQMHVVLSQVIFDVFENWLVKYYISSNLQSLSPEVVADKIFGKIQFVNLSKLLKSGLID